MRIGIKVGSALLTKTTLWGYVVNSDFIQKLMSQLSQLISEGHEVFLVSSGAVISDRVQDRNRTLRAAVGQHKLMALYQKCLDNICRDAAQILLVADELTVNRQHIQSLIEEAFRFKVLPIINANDAVNGDELDRLERFEDNDNLFLEVCLMLKPDVAIIATDVDGVLDDNKQVIHCFECFRDLEARGYIMEPFQDKSFGTGGMTSKIRVAETLTEEKIKTIIVNGRDNDFIELAIKQLTDGPTEGYSFGTVFVP